LRNAGYQTAAFALTPHMQRRFNFDQGFDMYDDNMPTPDRPSQMSLPEFRETAHKIRKRALAWFGSRYDPGRPYFMYLHYGDVHAPYSPPHPYDTLFSITGNDVERVSTRRKDLSELDRRFFMELYDAEIRYTDDSIEELFQELSAKGLLENTIVLYAADHGEAFYEAHPDDSPWYWHGRRLYEEEVRVPLIIRAPRMNSVDKRVTAAVSLVDLPATILELAGVEYKGLFQGTSLVPLMVDEEASRRPPVIAGGNHGRGMIIDNGWKYYARIKDPSIEKRFHQPLSAPNLPPDAQLFYLPEDPFETKNLIHERPGVAADMRRRLEELRRGGS